MSKDLDMKMFEALGRYQRRHGEDATVAILERFGVSRAIDVAPAEYARVIAACLADDDDSDDSSVPRRATRAGLKKAEGRKLSDMEIVINSAPDLKTGFNRVGLARNAARKAVAS